MPLNDSQKQCTATSKRSGNRCKNPAVSGSNVCRMHGGTQRKGIMHPNTKHGKYSKHLPTRMLAKYQESEADTDLLDLRAEISVVDARIADLMMRVDTGEAGATYKQLQQAWLQFDRALSDGDVEQLRYWRTTIDRLVNAGLSDYAAWNELSKLFEQRRRLVDSERRRLVDMENMITAEQAILKIMQISYAVKKHVTDSRTLAAIARDIDAAII